MADNISLLRIYHVSNYLYLVLLLCHSAQYNTMGLEFAQGKLELCNVNKVEYA